MEVLRKYKANLSDLLTIGFRFHTVIHGLVWNIEKITVGTGNFMTFIATRDISFI